MIKYFSFKKRYELLSGKFGGFYNIFSEEFDNIKEDEFT